MAGKDRPLLRIAAFWAGLLPIVATAFVVPMQVTALLIMLYFPAPLVLTLTWITNLQKRQVSLCVSFV